jgi:Cadmium resistance transporter
VLRTGRLCTHGRKRPRGSGRAVRRHQPRRHRDFVAVFRPGRGTARLGTASPGDRGEQAGSGPGGPTIPKVATTTFANGGDNIGVYVPVFTNVGTSGTIVCCVVFLILVGVWCAAGRFVATRPVIARPPGRWGHILLPVVLIAIGLLILIEGGVFGL